MHFSISIESSSHEEHDYGIQNGVLRKPERLARRNCFLRQDFWTSPRKIVNFETSGGIGATLSNVNHMVEHIRH